MKLFRKLNQLTDFKYERYLPTAFDNSLSLLEKIDKVIEFLNVVIETTNKIGEYVEEKTNEQDNKISDLRNEFEELKHYMLNGGLEENVINVLNVWFDNGKLAEIINNEVLDMKANQVDLDALDNRITSQLNETREESYLKYEQTDFVDLLRRYVTFDKMQIKKTDENIADVTIFNHQRFINFTFATYSDDYWVQSYVTTGKFSPMIQGNQQKYWSDSTRTGTWVNATNTVNGYTTEIGASFEFEIQLDNDSDGILLITNANSSGGMWKITIDGQEQFAKNVSCYSATSTKKKTLMGQFSEGVHTVKGVFIGADPAHPVSNPRGWLNSSVASTLEGGEVFTDPLNIELTLTTPSNKDFALNISPKNENNFEIIPFHGVNTAFNASPRVLYDDNETIDFISMVKNEFKSISSFTLKQHIYGRNSASGNTNLVELWSNQRLTKEGVLSLDGKIKVLKAIDIKNSYTIMGVAKGDLFTKIVSSIGNEYDNNPSKYGTNTQLTESDFGKSYIFVSETNDNIAIAFRYNDIRRTLRQNGNGKDTNPMLRAYLQHRDANVLKLYNRLFDNYSLEPGYTINYSGDYCFSYVPQIYDIVS